MDKGLVIIGLYFVASFAVVVLGLALTPEQSEINVTYINGILTASSILFGFWATLFGIRPKGAIGKTLYRDVLRGSVFFSIFLLSLSVVSVFFSAMNGLSSKSACGIVTFSFLMNLGFLGMHMHYHFELID